MARKFESDKLVIASHNPGKVREIGELLAPFALEMIPAASVGLAAPRETGATFRENAKLKAATAASLSGLPALADDSGLAIAALRGAPGIHSARWAGPTMDFAAAMERVERALAGKTDRRASFLCALALCWPGCQGADGHCEIFEGRVDGRLVWPPRGTRGFGYDPIFVPDGQKLTFGEMDPGEKFALSHRGDAFRQLVAACLEKG